MLYTDTGSSSDTQALTRKFQDSSGFIRSSWLDHLRSSDSGGQSHHMRRMPDPIRMTRKETSSRCCLLTSLTLEFSSFYCFYFFLLFFSSFWYNSLQAIFLYSIPLNTGTSYSIPICLDLQYSVCVCLWRVRVPKSAFGSAGACPQNLRLTQQVRVPEICVWLSRCVSPLQ